MDLHPLIWHEWVDDGHLSERSLIWIREHADPGDPQPLQTALVHLRAAIVGVREEVEPQVLDSADRTVEAWTWGYIPLCGDLDLRWPETEPIRFPPPR